MNGKPLLPADQLTFRDLSILAIRRWRLVFVGALGLLALGTMAWIFIPRLEEPRLEVPGLSITLVYPGASPEDIEIQVLKPVEEVLNDLPDVEYIESRALPSVASFGVRFTENANMDVMVEKARGKVMGKKRDLPAEVKDPVVVQWSTTRVPQMVVAVTGNVADSTLGEEARRIKSALLAMSGIAGVDLRGERKPAVRVRLDPVRLARHNLSADEVVRQLRLSNVRIPGGEFDVASLSTLLEVKHELTGAADTAKVPVGASHDRRGGTQTVGLGDVADVRDATLNAPERFAYNGQPAVGMEIRFRKDVDARAMGKRVRGLLEDFRPLLPPGVETVVCQDQPAWVTNSVHGFIESLLEGMALVLLVITLGMGVRAAVVVSGVIPLAVGGAVLGLLMLGFSIETVTIGGLIVALGLLVDDAVVVTESVQIMRDKGLSPARASVFGTARVFWANNGTTAVAVCSFLPLFAMGGDIGTYIKGLPTAVILCLVTSLAVAQLFTPWVATFLLRKPETTTDIPDERPYDRHEDRATGPHGERNPMLLFLRRVYSRLVPIVVARPGMVVLIFILLLGGSLTLFPLIGVQFFPKADKGVLFVSLELPQGSRLERGAEKLVAATAIIGHDPAVEQSSAVVGGTYPAIFSSRIGPVSGRNVVDMLVQLRPGADATQAATRLRQSLAQLSGVRPSVDELFFGPPVPHPVFVRVFGDDYAKLRAIAEEVKEQLRSIKGVVNVNDSLTDSLPLTRVDLDADRALRRGVTPAQVGQTLRWLYGEDKVTEFRRGEDLVEVVLDRTPEPDRPFDSLAETPIPSAAGTMVPLKDAGGAHLDHGYARLSRRNSRRMVEVWGDVEGDVLASSVVARLDPWLRARHWEPGYGFAYAGQQEETDKSFRKLGIAAVGALLMVFLLLLLMFDSLRLSALVVVAVPFALVGALPGLFITGNPFGFMAFLGLIALIGVYVNHKIYFVDRVIELMHRGEDLPTAILHAGQDRLRPVVLTALTAVLGLVPLTLHGAAMWSSFGWVNIFGLIASIPLSLVLLPALILLTDRWAQRWRRRRTAVPAVVAIVTLLGAAAARPAVAEDSAPATLRVEDAVVAALSKQPRLKAVESQVSAASARRREVALNRIGDLETTLLYTPSQQPLRIDFPGIEPLIPPTSFDVTQVQKYAISSSYTLPLWTFGALSSERRAARNGEQAAQLALARARQQTTLEAEKTFYQAAAAQAGAGVAEQNVAQQRAFLDLAQKRAAAGAAAHLDVLKAELAVARAQSDLVEATNRVQLAREALVTVTNDDRFRTAQLAPLEDEGEDLPQAQEAVGDALSGRPDLASQQSQAQAARAAGDALASARLPALAFRGQLIQQNADIGNVLDHRSQIYQLGFAVSWDLTKALRGGAAVAEQRAREQQLIESRRAAEAQAALQVRSALSSVREARERVRLQRHAVQVAEEQARVARLAYAEGVITSVEAQDAELGLTAARFALLRARLDAATARAELKFAVGE